MTPTGTARPAGSTTSGTTSSCTSSRGPRLEADGTDIGVVTSIVGLVGYRARVMGRTNHAGTTPMRVRRDALAGAARMVLAIRDQARGREDASANVGVIGSRPQQQRRPRGLRAVDRSAGALGRVDVRAGRGLPGGLRAIADEEGLGLELAETACPRADVRRARRADRGRGRDRGASAARMPSGAGHDAMVLRGPRVRRGCCSCPAAAASATRPTSTARRRSASWAPGCWRGLWPRWSRDVAAQDRLGSRGDRRRRGHRWDLHRPDALRHRLGGRPRPQGPLDARRAERAMVEGLSSSAPRPAWTRGRRRRSTTGRPSPRTPCSRSRARRRG